MRTETQSKDDMNDNPKKFRRSLLSLLRSVVFYLSIVVVYWVFTFSALDNQHSGLAASVAVPSTVYSPNESTVVQQQVGLTASPNDWAQVQKNPQRTGFTSETIGSNISIAWTHPFQPDKVFPQVQAIVYSGKLFVGTEMGNLYALDAVSGNQLWVFPVGKPILNSVAADWNKVFFGAMDGAVYALDANSGALVWKNQLSERLGFSTAPVLAEGKVMLGGRNGIFYALDQEIGEVVWQYDVNAPILQTAAWDNGLVFFGAMDMRVYAVRTTGSPPAAGSLAWQSEKITGMAFIDYWPVIYDNRVIIRPFPDRISPGIQPGFPFLWFGTTQQWNWLIQYGPTIAQGNLISVHDAMTAQNTVMADYMQNPDTYTNNLYLLNQNTGIESEVVPNWSNQTMNGGTTPPCIDRDGKLVVPIMLARSGWGRLDLSSRVIIDILFDNRSTNGSILKPGETPAGMGNRDESLNVTCTANSIVAMHTEEGNANYTGSFNLDSRIWTRIPPGHTNLQMSTNTQGRGGNPASISNGFIYHISYHEIIARITQP